MSPSTQVILSGALTFGAPLALAIRELIVLRRHGRGPQGGLPIDPPRPHKPLPDCLIPRPLVRIRELEDA